MALWVTVGNINGSKARGKKVIICDSRAVQQTLRNQQHAYDPGKHYSLSRHL